MKTVTLQLFTQGHWHDAAELQFADNTFNAEVKLAYFFDYIAQVNEYQAKDNNACSVNAPVGVIPTEYSGWPALLDDMLPVGKARQWWLNFLDTSRGSEFEQNYALLTHACSAPIGNLRIKEAVNYAKQKSQKRFHLQDAVRLQYEFLEYANEHGAAVGGGTGAVGVAPKLLLMVDADEVYMDADFTGKPLSAIPYLTKFARNTRTHLDNSVLKAEGVYYRVLAKILGDIPIDCIDVNRMMTHEHDGQVSLWLPRFDIEIKDGIAHRLGMESIYSMLNAAPGSYQNHFTVIQQIWNKIRDCTAMSSQDFVKQYVARDMLNLVFGNSDNHGRNISFLKSENSIRFAPIYDFAPMKADPEMVTRLFKWEQGCEMAGEVDFKRVASVLDDYCEPAELLLFLSEIAQKLLELPTLLVEFDCPEKILNFPAIGIHNTSQKLQKMGVLE